MTDESVVQTDGVTRVEEENPEGAKHLKWAALLETAVVDFFTAYKLEKMSLEDGSGNKAKLSLTKDNGIKIEYSSTTIL